MRTSQKPIHWLFISFTLFFGINSLQLSAQSYYGISDQLKADSSDLYVAQQLSILIRKGKINTTDSTQFLNTKKAVNSLFDSIGGKMNAVEFALPISKDSLIRVLNDYADFSEVLTINKITEIENSLRSDTSRLRPLNERREKIFEIQNEQRLASKVKKLKAFLNNEEPPAQRNNISNDSLLEVWSNSIIDSVQRTITGSLTEIKRRSENNQKEILRLRTNIDTSFVSAVRYWVPQKFNGRFEASKSEDTPQQTIQVIMESSLPAKSIPSESEIIDAVSVLIANRFKEEMTLSFFSTLNTFLKKDSLLNIIFPNTLRVMSSIESYVKPSMGPVWKGAFAKDMASIPKSLSEYLCPNGDCNENNSQFLNKNHAVLLYTLVSMLDQTKKGSNFFDVVNIAYQNVSNDYKNSGSDTSSGFRFLDQLRYFNKNLVDYKNGTDYFVSYQTYADLEPVAKNYFISSIANRLNNRVHPISEELTERLPYIIEAYKRLENEIIYLQSNENITVSDGLSRYWDAIEGIIDEVARLYPDDKEIQKVKLIAKSVIEIQKLIELKDFGGLPMPVIDLLKALMPERTIWNIDGDLGDNLRDIHQKNPNAVCRVELNQELNDFMTGKATVFNTSICNSADIQSELQEIKNLLEEDSASMRKFAEFNSKSTLDNVLNTLSFISDVLTVSESKELTEIILSKAAPVSSYKISRTSRFSWGINSYPGMYLGLEGIMEEGLSNPALVFGFTAPVGLSFSRGHRKKVESPEDLIEKQSFQKSNGKFKTLTGHSHSLFVGIFDLAAPVAFRIQKGEGQALPYEVTFSQFWAPSLFYVWGIKKTPLSIMLGVQINPQLRSFTESANQDNTASAKMALTFDIPLFSISHAVNKKSRYDVF